MKILSCIFALLLGFSSYSYTEWTVEKNNDPFDGGSTNVYSMSVNGKGGIAFDSKNRILIDNGDSYICSDSGSSYNHTEVSFKLGNEIFTQEFAISNNNSLLIYKEDLIGSGLTISDSKFTRTFSIKYWSNRAIDVRKFINELKNHDTMLIRTSDSCGTVANLEFDLRDFDEAISQLYR